MNEVFWEAGTVGGNTPTETSSFQLLQVQRALLHMVTVVAESKL